MSAESIFFRTGNIRQGSGGANAKKRYFEQNLVVFTLISQVHK
jgi:hypothetical protein